MLGSFSKAAATVKKKIKTKNKKNKDLRENFFSFFLFQNQWLTSGFCGILGATRPLYLPKRPKNDPKTTQKRLF